MIGYLNSTSPTTYAIYTDAFREGLLSTGYVEGVTVAIEYRSADGRNDRLPALAAELVRQQVAVIVATAAPKRCRSEGRDQDDPDCFYFWR